MIRGIAVFAFAGFLSIGTGCATTQQQQQQGENAENQGNEEGNDVNASFGQGNNAGNGNGNANGEGGQENGNQEGNNTLEAGNEANLMEDEGGNNGEFVNNADAEATFDQGGGNGGNMLANNGGMDDGAMMDEGAAGQDVGATVNNATEMEDFGAMNANVANPAVPVEQPVVDATVNGVVDQSSDMGVPAAANPMAGAMPGAGVVRYVPEGGTQLYSDQDRTNVVKSLEQGDHPLVVENGEWARTSDGYYVSASGLTPRPIGRFKAPAEWQ